MNPHCISYLLFLLITAVHGCNYPCKSCINITCQECQQGYYLDGNTCQLCGMMGCRHCSGKYNCLECSKFSYLTNDSQNATCQPCGNPVHTCLNCTSNGCKQARFNAYINNGYAYLCPQGCKSCLNDTFCTSCLFLYYLSGHKCLKCKQGCKQCTNFSNCSSCIAPYYLANFSCVQCSKQFFLTQNNTCISCGENCQDCRTFTGCVKCRHINTFIENKICQYCSDGCFQCSSLEMCIQCSSGFIMSNGLCEKIVITYSNSDHKVLIILSVVIIIISGIYIYFCGIPFLRRLYFQNVQSQRIELSDAEIISNDVCSICLINQGFCIISCGHAFHAACIYQWFKDRNDCPMCRKTLRVLVRVKCKNCRKQGLKGHIKTIEGLRELAALKHFACINCNALLEDI